MMARVRALSKQNPVAEIFLIAWAFAYMIEGASGFGTPVALAAPMLVSLGHDPVASIACCLVMNTLATPCAPARPSDCGQTLTRSYMSFAPAVPACSMSQCYGVQPLRSQLVAAAPMRQECQ